MPKIIERTSMDFFIALIKDPDRKSIFRMVYELLILLYVYKEIPVHYFSRYLFKKEKTNFRDFLPNKFLEKKVAPYFNDKSVKDVLDNKLFFDMFYNNFDIRIPKILMFNNKRMYVAGNRSIIVNNVNDFIVLLEEILGQNSSVDSVFIKKTNASSSGKNIYKLFRSELQTDTQKINEIFSEVSRSEYLFQETVKQHPDLNILNPSSLNTIRIDTFIDTNGKIEVISAHIRMSINNLHVDNIGSGGCFVGINLKTGELKKYGYSTIDITGVKPLTEHPLTKTVFENFRIPFISQVIELVIKTASYMPGLRLVGWDVAIGESGPVLIEGNSDYEIRGNDAADGGYLANPVFRKVLHEINYL
jgi:hypothetical protein